MNSDKKFFSERIGKIGINEKMQSNAGYFFLLITRIPTTLDCIVSLNNKIVSLFFFLEDWAKS